MVGAVLSVWTERLLVPVRAVLAGGTEAPPREPGQATPRRRRTAGPLAGVTAVYFLVTWFEMGRAITACTTDIIGHPGDATAGFTWFTWADRAAGPVPGFRHLTNAPFGESLGNPDQITAALPILAMWAFGRITTPFCAWNLLVLFGYLSSALTMFGLVRWLTRNTWAGFFAGFAVTYTPYHQLNAQGHVSYLLNFILTLVLWAFFAFWARPAPLRAVSLAVATAACAYIDGYFILLVAVLIVPAVTVAVLADSGPGRGGPVMRRRRLRGLAVSAGAGAVLLAPIAWVQYAYGRQIAVALACSRDAISREATVYSARPYEYLMPAPGNPLLPRSYATDLYTPSSLHGSNYTEAVVYVGLVVLVLAAVAWIRLWRHRRRGHDRLRGLPVPLVVTTMTATMLVAFLFSMPPDTTLAGLRLPLPTSLVIHLTAAWRVFARLYLVVDTCLVVIAGVGLWFVIRRLTPKRQGVVAVVAVSLAFADFLTGAAGAVWSASRAPAVYGWLRTRGDVRLVAEYPLAEPPSQGILDYLTYQQIDGKARFNTFRTDSPQRALHLSMLGLADAQTVPILRAVGVQLVLVHRTPGGAPGLRLLRRDRSRYNDDVRTYRVLPGRGASYAVVLSEGFHQPQLRDPLHSVIGTGTDGVLTLRPLPGGRKAQRVRVTLMARAPGRAEPVRIRQNGVVRWAGVVAGRPTRITFTADTARPVHVMPQYPVAGDTIRIWDMNVHP